MNHSESNKHEKWKYHLRLWMLIGLFISTCYAIIVLIISAAAILSLGNFSSFQALQTLLLSLLVGLVSFIVVKPTYRLTNKYINAIEYLLSKEQNKKQNNEGQNNE